PATEYVYAAARQPDGRIVVAGRTEDGTTSDALVARFNADGSLDATFGAGGLSIKSFSSYSNFDDLYDVAIQPDGKIVGVGKATATFPKKTIAHDMLIARFLGAPAPLLAPAASPAPVRQSIVTAAQARPALVQALAYWRSRGEDTTRLGHIDLAIADL